MNDEEKRRWRGKPETGGGERQLTTRVKNKRAKESSRKWIERQLNDPYVARAKAEGIGTALAATRFDFAHRALTGLRGLNEPGFSSLIGFSEKLPLRDVRRS